MVSHSARVVFVHVQKTGGSTIDAHLRAVLPDAGGVPVGGAGRHARLRTILRRHPELSTYWIFGFVRNPWDRLASWHAMILRRGQEAAAGDEDVARKLDRNDLWQTVLADYADFEAFVLRGLDDIPDLARPQVSYLRARGRMADFIGRQETFDVDMRAVLARLGLDGDIVESVNAAPERRDYREAYTPAMQEKVAHAFRRDLQAFGYEF